MSSTAVPAATPEGEAGWNHREGQAVGAAIALLGAVLVLVGSFLPIHKVGILPVPGNSFVSDGNWWVLVAAVMMVVAGLYELLGGDTVAEWRIIIPSVAAVIAGIIGLTHSFQRLSLSPTGQQLFGVKSVRATVGVGVYLVLAGGAVGLLGAGLLRGWWRPPAAVPLSEVTAAATKKCPDCAETILADAHVCKHCGYRFQSPLPDSPPARP